MENVYIDNFRGCTIWKLWENTNKNVRFFISVCVNTVWHNCHCGLICAARLNVNVVYLAGNTSTSKCSWLVLIKQSSVKKNVLWSGGTISGSLISTLFACKWLLHVLDALPKPSLPYMQHAHPFNRPSNIWWTVQLWCSQIKHFSASSCHFLPLSSSSVPCSQIACLHSLFRVTDQAMLFTCLSLPECGNIHVNICTISFRIAMRGPCITWLLFIAFNM